MLADVANSPTFRGVHRPNPAIVGARLDAYLTIVAERVQTSLGVSFCDFHFRLYDGWFDETGYGTELYHLVRRHIHVAYPTRKKTYRVFVEIAEAPLACPRDRLLHTFREQSGLTRHHIGVVSDLPSACFDRVHCGIVQLRSWIRGSCPVHQCEVPTSHAAYFRQQKLVDTTLVADLVWGASQGNTIVAVSDDEDLVPGLITARAYGAPVSWACRTERPRAAYASILSSNRVEYIHADY